MFLLEIIFGSRNEPSMALGNGSASVAMPSVGKHIHHILLTLPSSCFTVPKLLGAWDKQDFCPGGGGHL